jgi:hypothetical protein
MSLNGYALKYALRTLPDGTVSYSYKGMPRNKCFPFLTMKTLHVRKYFGLAHLRIADSTI